MRLYLVKTTRSIMTKSNCSVICAILIVIILLCSQLAVSKGLEVKFDPKKTVFLIDGSSFLYRAYYSLRPLHTPTGVPVQAVYSFCRMIKRLITMFSAERIVLVWDSKGKTTRHEMYREYKATRQAPPSDLFDQKEIIVEFADLIGLPQIAQQGIEADDIMFSIAKECKKAGDMVVFITLDKDMAQALDEQTVLFDAFKDQVIDTAAFEEKMGFAVKKLPFYFALLGDASDNIPGVRGIGKKGALDLVRQFDSLEDLYANLDKVAKERIRRALEENKDNALLSEQLFLLQYHPSGLKRRDLAFNIANWGNARPLFEKLNFKSLVQEIDKMEAQGAVPAKERVEKLVGYTFKIVTTRQELDELCTLLKKKKIFALDTETNGVRALQDDFVGISFCVEEGTAYYIPFGHQTEEQQLPRDEVLRALKPILEDEQYKKYLHNVKFDQLVLYNNGINLTGVVFDSLVAARLLIKEWQSPSLKSMSIYCFDEPMLTYEEIVKQTKLKDFSYVPLDVATRYSAGDSHQTFKLAKRLEKDLKKEELATLYQGIEFPLIDVLFNMEAEGIFLDKTVLDVLSAQVTQELVAVEDEILALVDRKEINLNSPKQVEDLLFYQLKLPPQKKRAKGNGYSTDQEVLEILAPMHPVPGLILKYRELSKLKNTYIDALPHYINPKTKRIHTTYSQTSVATGRLASYNPNLQNIPTDATGYGIEVRAAFKPKKGNVFLSADYSQIELRVLAQFSKDKNLVDAFLEGHDIHAETAAHLFDVPLATVTHKQRQIGKRINFSILYGLTPYGLSKDLGIPFKDAKQYIEKYFEQYPGVSQWMEAVIEETKEKGYVTTWHGRRRFIPGIYEKNKTLYEEARRIAINTKAQGSAAEIMKLGMINVAKAFKKYNLDAHILLQIHDELLITVPKDQQAATEKVVKEALESVVDWEVPLKVTTRFGKDWKEVTK